MMAQFWVFGQTSTSVAADQVSQSHVPLQWCLCQPQQAAGWPGLWQLCHHHLGLHQLKCLTFRLGSHLLLTMLAVHDIDPTHPLLYGQDRQHLQPHHWPRAAAAAFMSSADANCPHSCGFHVFQSRNCDASWTWTAYVRDLTLDSMVAPHERQ